MSKYHWIQALGWNILQTCNLFWSMGIACPFCHEEVPAGAYGIGSITLGRKSGE